MPYDDGWRICKEDHTMKAVKETIGNTPVLIQTMGESPEIVGRADEEPDIVDTGIGDDIKDAYAKARAVINGIAEDVGAGLNSLQAEKCPTQMEIEFSLGLSAEAKAWVIGAKTDYALKVKITWESGAKEV
jgi:hypothetical protein